MVRQDEIGKMAQALSETEDRYMKAIVESQQTVATAALERYVTSCTHICSAIHCIQLLVWWTDLALL